MSRALEKPLIITKSDYNTEKEEGGCGEDQKLAGAPVVAARPAPASRVRRVVCAPAHNHTSNYRHFILARRFIQNTIATAIEIRVLVVKCSHYKHATTLRRVI